jgi:nucleotide-binding universal stress UspA family protein
MYSKILVAVDGSPGSSAALTHASALSRAFGAELRILHVVDMGFLPLGPELALDIGRLAEARRANGRRILKEAQEAAQALGVAAEFRLVETMAPTQRVADAIADEAGSWSADLIAVGAQGQRDVERFFLGSVAERVARRANVAVLLVQP